MNLERGEVTLTLDGVDHLARPSHDAMASIEAMTGKGIIEVMDNVSTMRASIAEIVAILYTCVAEVEQPKKNTDMPWTIKHLSKLVYKKGIVAMSAPALTLITVMCAGETVEELTEKNDHSTDTATP